MVHEYQENLYICCVGLSYIRPAEPLRLFEDGQGLSFPTQWGSQMRKDDIEWTKALRYRIGHQVGLLPYHPSLQCMFDFASY